MKINVTGNKSRETIFGNIQEGETFRYSTEDAECVSIVTDGGRESGDRICCELKSGMLFGVDANDKVFPVDAKVNING